MTSSRQNYSNLAAVLGTVSDADALKILDEASRGFRSGNTTIKELKLTPRKYYRNLKRLTDAGIAFDSGNGYKLTPLGELVHNLVFGELDSFLLSNQNQLKKLPPISNRRQLMVIDDYKKLVDFLANSIDKAKSEILLATRFVDFAVIQSLAYALERNVKLKTLNDTQLDYPAFFKLIEVVHRDIRPSISNFFIDANKHYRSVDVPLSFIVIDDEITLFEIPNKQFKTAFVSVDTSIVASLTRFFWELWNQSTSLNVPNWQF